MNSARLVGRSHWQSRIRGLIQFFSLSEVASSSLQVYKSQHSVGNTRMKRNKCHAAQRLHDFTGVGCVAAGLAGLE